MRFKAQRGIATKMAETLPTGARFGEAQVCWWCGRRVRYGREFRNTPTQATREHVVPRSLAGTGAGSNVVVACGQCNSTRRSDTDWVPYHRLADVATNIPQRQWQHLERIERMPTRVAWKKAPG